MPGLADIGAALLTQLETLGPEGTGAFATVGWFAGEVRQEGVDQELLGNSPAILLALETDDLVESETIRTMAKPISMVVSRAVWRVHVIVETPKGETEAAQGDSSDAGFLGLLDKVSKAIVGFDLPGLLRERVEYLGRRPIYIQRGVTYVYAVRLATKYVVDLNDDAESAAGLPELLNLVGEIDLDDADGVTVDAFSQFETP